MATVVKEINKHMAMLLPEEQQQVKYLGKLFYKYTS